MTSSNSQVKTFRSRLDKTLADYRHARRVVAEEKVCLKKARKELTSTEEAQSVIQTVAQSVQQKVHDRISAVVSRCLKAVFDDPYEFKVLFERKRGKTEARLVFVKDGHELVPRSASGGGVLDVAAFALRLACLMMTRPPVRRLLVMDEPFRHLQPAEYYHPRVRDLLESLSRDMKVQFIIVSHEEELQTGRVVRIGRGRAPGADRRPPGGR